MKSFLIPFLSVLAAFGWGGPSSALAATGAAPPSQQRRIVSGVHADAISVSYENERLLLGSKADLDGNFGVRLDPNLTVFNVEQSRKTKIPNAPSFAFLGTPGSDVWIAPEPNPGPGALWPGFSTEGVPTGVLDGNQLTFRLDAVTGPGTVHIFQNSAFGEPVRLLTGTGTDFRTWTVPRGTHAHANWAFSAPGHYLLTFTATAMTNGVSISATQDYAFVVGDVPPATVSTTTLAVNTNATVLGSPISLSATVSPANAVGWVEFLDGATILGHDAVNAGSAALSTMSLPLGTHSVTARFVPQWLNDFSPSTSAPVEITVADESGVTFAVTGIEESYQPGDVLLAQAVGYTPPAGEMFVWYIRPVGTSISGFGEFGTDFAGALQGNLTLPLDAGRNGYELKVVVVDGNFVGTGLESAWVPISVGPMPGVAPVSTQFPAGSHYNGDVLTFPIGRDFAPGETGQVVYRFRGSTWLPLPSAQVGDALQTRATWDLIRRTEVEFAVQINSGGIAVAQSAPISGPIGVREFQVEGQKGVYREGQTMMIEAAVVPPMDGLTYKWVIFDGQGAQSVLEEGSGPEAMTLELPMTLELNGRQVSLYAFADDLVGGTVLVSYWDTRLSVVSADSPQLFVFNQLADHYHQATPIDLILGANPNPAEGDTITWEWKWPGLDWEPLPGASGLSHQLTAEQALDGLQVRATLVFAREEVDPMLAGPVTILVDDHGAPARQQPTITGLTNVVVGNLVTLTRQLPANGATILTTHRWERKVFGTTNFVAIAGATNAQLTFTAALADDGGEYRVSILKPDGTVAYGPSPAVALDVTPPISSDFSITGVAASYQPGDILQARIAGVTLAEGQGIQWRVRPVGTDFTGTVLGQFVLPETNNPESRAGRLDLRLDASFDNYELQAAVIQADQTLGTTGWVPVRVSDAVQPLSLTYVGPQPFRIGDTATLAAQGRALAAGESLRVALYPGLPHYSLWFVPPSGYSPIAPGTFQFEPSGQALLPMALQVVRDGLVVAQSESLVVDAARVEFFFEGMQPVYRVGQTFSASIRTAPDLGDKVTYSWAMYDNYQNPMKVAKGEAGRTFEMPVTADMNGKRMFIQANVIYPSGNVGLVGGAYPFLTVTTNTAQLFLFSSLNEHYHQGDSVSLTLTADPGLTAADSVVWEWRWPGMGWETLPQAEGLSHQLTAEQAMDGLEVRAALNFGHTNVTLLAGPVTILVDDHGILALQQPKITGLTNVAAGDLVTLTRQLPANGATVLTTHRWERQAPGASEFTVISNATSAQITFTASQSDDGVQYRVAILKPNGELAYGPSPAVTLDIGARPTVSRLASRSVELGTSLAPITFTVGDAETAPADLVVTASSSNPVVLPNDSLVLGGSGANRTLSSTSALNHAGSTTITVTVSDSAGQQASNSFLLKVGNPIRATFDPSVGIVTATDPIDMRLVDIDNDGDLDVLFADRIRSISIIRNNGSGMFGKPNPLPAITVSDIHVADINGDNLPDILSSVYLDNTYAETAIGVWRNLGSGNFAVQEIVETTRTTNVVFLAGVRDIDGDGLRDIILSNSSVNGVSYSRNLGTGSFAPLTQIHPSHYAWWSALEDVDRDGDLDLVRAYNEDGVFRLQLLRNSGAAVPAFTVEELASFGENSLGSITIGDTDQDGSADIHLLKRTPAGNEVVVLRGTSTGAFLAPGVLVSGPELTDLKIGDLDGDGRPDLAVASRDRNQVLFAQNLGSGVFTDLQEFTTDGVYLNPGHEVVAIGDVDGDGRNDLVYMERFSKRIAWSRNRQGENITELKAPASRSYLNGYPMTFDVFFGFNVRLNTSGGSPTLPVTIGSQIIQVPLVGQPNANTLRFRHLVQSTDVDRDGIQVANSVALNGATITDVHGLPLAALLLELSSVDTTGIQVNGGAPYVTGITRLDATPAAASSVRYAVTFSEPVTGVTLDDFALDASGPAGAAITSATGSGDSYVVTASIGSGDGTLKLRVLDDDSTVDADSNPLGGVGKANGEFAYGQGYTIRSSTAEPVFNNVITDGHLDIVLLLFEGTWYPYWNGVGFWETADTVLSAGPDAKATRPADAKWDFLGAASGEPVWIFPETLSTTTPWPGVGAYDNQPGDFARYFESDPRVNATAEWLKMQLLAVRGPEGGQFSLYQSGITDPMVFMTTADGIGADDTAWIPNLDHIHYHWAFTKPGLYQVDVAASGYVDFNQSGTYEPGIDPLSESQVFTLNFAVEVKPFISQVPDQTIEAGSAASVLSFQVGDLETPAGELVVTATSSNQEVIPNSSIVLGGTGADRTITFPAGPLHEGETRILIKVVDASGLEATTSFLTRVEVSSARPDLRLSVSGGTATLLVATRAGQTYQLEVTRDLMLPWTDVGARIVGTGQVVEVNLPTTGPSGFFRWRIVTNP